MEWNINGIYIYIYVCTYVYIRTCVYMRVYVYLTLSGCISFTFNLIKKLHQKPSRYGFI